VLTDASIAGAEKDYLRGFKENVIMGRIIPAGTGVRQNIVIFIVMALVVRMMACRRNFIKNYLDKRLTIANENIHSLLLCAKKFDV
jgi:hypothetical protein